MRCPGVFRGRKFPHLMIVLAAILIVIGVVYKAIGVLFVKGGVGLHNAPLGVSPRAFLLMAGVLLLFSIATNLQHLVERKSTASLTPGQPAGPESGEPEA